MKNSLLRKSIASVLALSMTLSLGVGSGTAFAAGSDPGDSGSVTEPQQQIDYASYDAGVTVVKDDTSPTGYTAVFIFEEDSVNPADYGLKDIAKVQVYSDGMYLFSYDEQKSGTALDPNNYAHTPDEFSLEDGIMYPAGGDTSADLYGGKKIAYYEDMTEFEDGKWGTSIPLTSGATYYNYRLTDSEGTADTSYIDDPANPTMVNTESGVKSRSSMVYVPYDEEKMGNGQWADRTVENPREDGKTGTVEFASYTGTQGTDRYLGIYLPYGYDPDREEPYNVLYMSHGAQSEATGCELRWLNECAAVNIMDNLEGDFIVVTMNNTGLSDGNSWNFDEIWAEQELIMDYVETNYNVGTDAASRGFAGLSMGGITASRMYAYHADQFGYIGIWSAADTSALTSLTDEQKEALKAQDCKISIGAGDWDYLLNLTQIFAGQLDELGIDYDFLTVPGSHDWRTWQAIFAETVENFFWKDDSSQPAVDYSQYDEGVTVEADENSPTGYTATFIYKEQSLDELNAYKSYNTANPKEETSSVVLTGDVAKVEIYSDCFMLFDPEDPEMEKGVAIQTYADKGIQPYDYRAGLTPAGGNGQTAVSIELTEFADGMWGVQVPLSSGAFVYNYRITDTNGVSRDRYQDPANPTLWNEATGIHSLSSMVYVPYDADKQGTSEWADRSVENPRTDGKTGQVVTVSYEGNNVGYDYETNNRGLAIYLPYGYDPDRAEPYKVLYISMGTSGDHQGNELRWLQEGAAANIMDNLIAEGKAEPFIIVSMNNQDLGTDRGSSFWDREKAWEEQELIFKYMEENYNVGTTSAYRAYAGLSQGGGQTTYMLAEHTDAFDYYGVYSAGSTTGGTDIVSTNIDKIKAESDHIHVYAGTGYWDGLYNESLYETMVANGIDAMFKDVPGAHDWEAWQLLLADSVENFFFKDDSSEPAVDYSKYDAGVTVEADANSPTGYTATFVYDELDSYDGLTGDIAKVELYSDCFMLFDPNEGEHAAAIDPALGHSPYDYQAGMVGAGGNGDTTVYVEMTQFADGLWGAQVPLSSGAFVYNFRVTDENGTQKSRLDDPSNPTLTNTATGIHSLSSMVYIPYDEEKMGDSQWADRSVELPQADPTKQGTVETVAYTGAAGDQRGLAVYLPAGYDADRSEPYKVLYLSHGASGDQTGNELRWMNEGAVANIMDNLIAEGKTEPFVVVTMNNQDLGWNYDKIWAEQQLIMAYIESNYNVCDSAEGRAFAGLSMGGWTTSQMYLNHADQFSYYGIWSHSATGADLDKIGTMDAQDDVNIMLGCGIWDALKKNVDAFGEALTAKGISHDYYEVAAAHDWEAWQLLYAYAAENFFWKNDSSEPEVDYTQYDAGVTVEADENSPTGYTATFVYDELDSYDGLTGDIAKVELYSDCFMLFNPDEGTPGVIDPALGHTPYEYEAGMVGAGGNGDTTIYVEMTQFADGLWGAQVPLSSGAFVYNFRVTDENGTQKSRLDDPSNPTLTNTATGIHSLSSMVYIPYNEEKMGDSQWADRSVELPQADPAKQGTVETVAYTGAAGDQRGLAVYLPAGYDPDRAEPYKVLYLSHGSSGDQTGNELRWMNEGAAANIMDNLIAEGKAEPFVVVTMNNQDFGWDYSKIEDDQFNYIMPYIEEHYNVYDTAEGRAYAGLSAGGRTANRMYFNHADEFAYFGIWSYACTGDELDAIDTYENLDKPNLMLGAGKWDYLLSAVQDLGAALDERDIDYQFLEVPAAHDWETWQLLYAYAVENFFWKADSSEPAVDYTKYDAGVTVEADANSPTGYTATFIYKEQSLDELNAYKSYNTANPKEETSNVVLTGDVAKVEIYSDCFMLFDPEDPEMEKGVAIATYADKGIQPYDYRAGLAPAGGNGDTAVSIALTEFADGMWGVQVPLSSGAFVYNYRITDTNGVSRDRYQDPANPTLWNEATGIHSLSSMVYVPYDADKQGTSEWADRSVELPRTDGKTGQVVTVSYEGKNVGYDYETNNRGLAIYLPYGYDPDRAEPYKVLYVSMGTSGDHQGNELRWLNEGDAANIMDNLIAEGKAEPFIIVSMNNQDLGTDRGSTSWDREKAWEEQELIFKYMEENYNVGTTSAYRAYAGLSQGGSQTAYMLAEHTDAFDYYGILSSGGSDLVTNNIDKLKAESDHIHVYAGTGYWDGAYNKSLYDTLVANGIDAMFKDVPGAHDWETWQLLLADSVENFFWKADSSEPAVDYTKYDAGVTVEADANSPTGYTATFVYDELDSYDGLTGDIAKVELYSDCFMLFNPDEGEYGSIDPALGHSPYDYQAGMVGAGGNGDTTVYVEMTQFADGMWGVQVPLSSGAFVYNFRVTDENGTQKSRLDDPSNPTLTNTATGIHSLSSMVYIPYDEEKMGDSQWADRSVELPQADASKKGTVETVAYTGAAGDQRGLAVYLPAGYDADRSEPYKVLYLSHGNSGDQTGNELRWMNEGAVANIMDNLIAEGKTEPFVVVTMNNQDLGWNYDKIWAEQELIMAYIESNYNVCDTAEGRAFAGLSMGGITTSNMYLNHGDQFSYYGIWSAANTDLTGKEDYIASLGDSPKLMMAAGKWDFGRSSVQTLKDSLEKLGVSSTYLEVPAAHDWECWQLIYAYAAENFFWKDDSSEPTVDYTKYDAGVTVEADENSPTGYTATFVYDELDSYDGLTGDIVKVELYSDCFMLFDPDEGEYGSIDASLGHSPYDYETGMVPAGGDGSTTVYVEMTQFADGMWGVQVPLSSGAFVYNFRVTDENGTQKARLDDPSNPTLTNTATGIHSLSSMVYVPYDEEKMGTGPWADRSVELPQADASKKGTVETVAYTGAAGDQRGLAVYLPAGYDPDRSEPYKVLYLSHGNSGDLKGNELRWMNEGAVANIMDNLIAEGKAEPFVVVTMNNQDLGDGSTGWNYDKIWAEQELIMAYIESNYNVCDTASGRAFAGLSMGGWTTSNMYLNHGDQFSYFGIWSYANNNIEGKEDYIASLDNKPNLMMAAGKWDFGRSVVQSLRSSLEELGVSSTYLEVPAAHDWECWQLIYAYAVENFFWKADQETPDQPGSGGGSGTQQPDTSKLPFVDVDDSDWYYEAVKYAYENDLFSGISNTTFGPNVTMTRAMLVTVLYSMEGKPAVSGGTTFADVSADAWYRNAVIWATQNNIVAGYSASEFGANDPVTREQMALILYGYAKAKGYDVSESGSLTAFNDKDQVSDWAVEAVQWAVGAGLLSGKGNSQLDPASSALRSEVAQILMRFVQEVRG